MNMAQLNKLLKNSGEWMVPVTAVTMLFVMLVPLPGFVLDLLRWRQGLYGSIDNATEHLGTSIDATEREPTVEYLFARYVKPATGSPALYSSKDA